MNQSYLAETQKLRYFFVKRDNLKVLVKLSPLTSTFVTKQTKIKIPTKLRIPQIGYILAVVIRIIRNFYYGGRGDRVIL